MSRHRTSSVAGTAGLVSAAIVAVLVGTVVTIAIAALIGGWVVMLVQGGVAANFDQVKETWSYGQSVMASVALAVVGSYFKSPSVKS